MRAFLTYLLASILLICPALCQAAEMACCAEHCGESDAQPDQDRAPEAPNEATSCICAGAIKDGSSGLSKLRSAGVLSPLDAVLSPSLLPADVALLHSSRGGAPPGPSERGSPPRIHLLLMTFRC